MNKFKIIGLTCLLTFSSAAIAQEKRFESEIVMTKDELKSFLETVAEARRKQLRTENRVADQKYLMQLRENYNNAHRGSGNHEISNYEILRELDRLNARLDVLSSHGNLGKDNSTIVVPGSGTTGNALDTERKIWELEKQLAELKKEAKGENGSDVEQRFQDLEDRLANADSPAERRSLLEELLAKFKNFKRQVFFANDSKKLTQADYDYIEDVSEVLKKYPELSVMLEGWASPPGTVNYNKQLSMARSEVVEQALINRGIKADRIATSFKGEDHTTTEAKARRVDMSIILK